MTQEERDVMKELADDLQAHIEYTYAKTLSYPHMRAKYDRDMVPVYRARALLSQSSTS